MRWKSILGSVLVALGVVASAAAQTTLIGGGLTRRPTPAYDNVLANGGFESLGGAVPSSWAPSGTWNADQIVKRTGTFSYRLSSAGAQASQTLQLQPGVYRLSGWIKTQSGGSGSTRLTLDFRPGVNAWSPTPDLSGTNDWTYQEVLVTVPEARSARVVLDGFYATSGFQAWYDDVKLEREQTLPISAFMLYPNFRGMLFDDQSPTMKFDVAVRPPSGEASQYTVRATLAAETSATVVTSRTYPGAASFTADLDGSAMQPGQGYLVTFSLVDGNGGTVGSYPAYRVSRVPASARAAMNVSFDAKNRVLMKGTPRFILGVYDSGSGYSTSDSFWENQLWSPTGERRMDGLKINMYLNYWYGAAPVDAMNALMGNLQKRGVMYLQTGNCFDKWPADGNFQINASDSYVQQFGSHAGSAGYYTIDECLAALVPGAFTQYERLRRLDPDSVTFSANFGTPDLLLWRDAADILSTDPYPLFGAEPAGGYNHRQVADWTANTRNVLKDSRPFMTVLQFFKFTSQGRWPTRQDLRNHATMAIVEGARGLWWWSLGDNALKAVCSGWCEEKTAHMNNLKAVVNEIAALEPALIADDAPTALTGNSNASAIKTKVKLVNGTGYVFAYNATNAQASTTFTWNTAPGTVTVNAENRTLGASGNSFTDSFGPYQAHVYVIGNGGTGGTGGTGGGSTGGGTGETSAPTLSFTNPAASTTSVSGTVTVTLAASGGSGSGYVYRLAVDGATVYTGTNPSFSWNTTAVSNASHTLTGTVTDSAGKSGSASRTLTVSNTTTTPPPPTGALQVFVTAPTSGATVSGTNWAVIWVQGASGTSNAYTLTAGGQTVGTTTTSSTGPVSIPWNTALLVDGSHMLTASVRDATGKTGSGSVSVTVKNGTSTTSPLTLAFTSPAEGATVSGTVSVALRAGGGTGYSYTLAVDGGAARTVAATSSWNTTTAINGSHTLRATVRDAAGRTVSATRTVKVSNVAMTPLAVWFTAPAAGATVSGTVSVAVTASGGIGYSYTLAVDSTQVATASSFAWNTTTVANGSHTLRATVRDAAGRTASVMRTVTVSNTAAAPPPTGSLQVAVTQPTGGATVSGTHWAVVWVSGATGTRTYTLTAAGKTVGSATGSGDPTSIPWDTRAVADGSQTLTVTVRDGAGNTGTASVSVTVLNATTTTTNPTPTPTGTLQVAVTQPTGGATVSGTQWVIVWVNGATGTSTVTLSVNGATVGTGSGSGGPISIPWTTSGAGNGSRTLAVSARDGAGNTGSTSVTVTVAN
jgi:hypothetical protein